MNAPEQWRVVSRNRNYEVSSLGRIRRLTAYRSTRVGHVLAQRLDRDGYPRVGLSLAGRIIGTAVHVLVCEAFHGPRPSPDHECAHGDGVRSHCGEANLRWATPAENQADRVLHGTDPVGVRNPAARLTPVNVWAIRARYLLGEPCASLGRSFGISGSHAKRVAVGDAWTSEPAVDPTPFLNPAFLAHLESCQ